MGSQQLWLEPAPHTQHHAAAEALWPQPWERGAYPVSVSDSDWSPSTVLGMAGPQSLAVLMFPGPGRTLQAKGTCLSEGGPCLCLAFFPSHLATGPFLYYRSCQLARLFREDPRKQVIHKAQWQK